MDPRLLLDQLQIPEEIQGTRKCSVKSSDGNDKTVFKKFTMPIELLDGAPEELYYPVNGEYTNAETTSGKALFIEFDHRPCCLLPKPAQANDYNTPGGKDEFIGDAQILHVLETCGIYDLPAPTAMVQVGYGYHYYWVLSEPMTDLNQWSEYQVLLALVFGSDRTLKNPSRLMRLPGGWHKRTQTKVELVECGQPVALEEITVPFALVPRYQAPVTHVAPRDKGTNDVDQLLASGHPSQIFTWPNHDFQQHGSKWKGDCPGHKSSSKTSFWVHQHPETGTWLWACPTCTDNKQHNALAYHHWLNTGILAQPTGIDYQLAVESVGGTLGSQTEALWEGLSLAEMESIADMKSITEVDEPGKRQSSRKWEKFREMRDAILLIDDPDEKSFEINQLARAYGVSTKMLKESLTPPPTPKFESGRDFQAAMASEESTQFLYEGLVPRGELLLISAKAGCGKSVMATQLVAAMSNGRPFLGVDYQGAGRKILCCADDESRHTWFNRANKMGLNWDRVDRISRVKANDLGALEDAIMGGAYELVVIDSLTTLNSGVVPDENHPSAADGLYALAELAHSYDCTVIVLHHNNKSDTTAGSARLEAPGWATWVIRKHETLPSDYRSLDTGKIREGQTWCAILKMDFESAEPYQVEQRAYGTNVNEVVATHASATFWSHNQPKQQYQILGLDQLEPAQPTKPTVNITLPLFETHDLPTPTLPKPISSEDATIPSSTSTEGPSPSTDWSRQDVDHYRSSGSDQAAETGLDSDHSTQGRTAEGDHPEFADSPGCDSQSTSVEAVTVRGVHLLSTDTGKLVVEKPDGVGGDPDNRRSSPQPGTTIPKRD